MRNRKNVALLFLIALLGITMLLVGCTSNSGDSTDQSKEKNEETGTEQSEAAEENTEDASTIDVQILEDEIIFSNDVISGKYLLTFETTRDDISMEGKRSFGGITELKHNGTDVLNTGGIIQPWNIYTWRPEFKDAWLYLEVPTAEVISQTDDEAVVRLTYHVKQTEGEGEYQADFDMTITQSSPVINFDVALTRLNAVDPTLEEYHEDFGEVPGFIEVVIQTDLGYGADTNVFINSHSKVEEGVYEDKGVQNISSFEANFDNWHWNNVYGWPNFRTAENWIVYAAPSEDKGVGFIHDGSLKWMTHYGPDHGSLVTLAARSLDEMGQQVEWKKANEASNKLQFSIFPYVSDTESAIEEARKLAK